MESTNGYPTLLRYKIRYIGIRNALRVGYLDLCDSLVYQMGRLIPWVYFSPRSIQIECTTRCNLRCTFCELSYWTEKPDDLTLLRIQELVERFPRLKRVDLTGIGESLMNREFFRIIEFLKSRGIYVSLNDNFTMITDDVARRLVELGIDQIFLSLDGATKKIYEEIRIGADFDKVLHNVRRLVAAKQERRARRPEIKINTVVCLSNYRELPAIVDLAHDLGIGMVQFVNVITFEDTAGLDVREAAREVHDYLRQARERARRLDMVVKIALFDKLPVQGCDFPWKRNFVTYDGYLHPCCYTTQSGDRKAQNSRSFGNLLDRSYRDIWNGELYSGFRRKMKAGVLPDACAHCPKYSGRKDSGPNERPPGGHS